MNTTVSATSRAKPVSWVTTIIVVPALGERLHHVEHLVDEFGVERARRFVEQHHLGLHGERPGDRDALLLTARQAARVVVGAVGESDLGEELARQLLGFAA